MRVNALLAQIRAHPGVIATRYDEATQTVTLRYDGTQTNMAAIEALVRRSRRDLAGAGDARCRRCRAER